jgi:Outer membrane protein beta-barrel domain
MLSFRRCVSAVIISFLALTHAAAQAPPAEPAPPPAPAEPPGPGRFQYGVTFDETAEPAAFEPTMNFGGFFNFAVTGMLSVQPEVLFAAKGERIRDKGAPPVITASGEEKPAPADRVVLVRYLEFPILLRLSKRTHENTSLYVIAGPAFAFRRNAVIRDVADSGRHEDIEEQVNSGDLSYVVGGGLQHKRWMADARLLRGVPNIAVDPSPAPVTTRAFSVLMGVRF